MFHCLVMSFRKHKGLCTFPMVADLFGEVLGKKYILAVWQRRTDILRTV